MHSIFGFAAWAVFEAGVFNDKARLLTQKVFPPFSWHFVSSILRIGCWHRRVRENRFSDAHAGCSMGTAPVGSQSDYIRGPQRHID